MNVSLDNYSSDYAALIGPTVLSSGSTQTLNNKSELIVMSQR